MKDFKVGSILRSKLYGDMEVIHINNSRDISVKFLKTDYVVTGLQKGNVVRGNVKDIFYPSVEGKGYLGTDRKVSNLQSYKCWKHMVVRCYSKNYHSTRETYKDCEVSDEWLNYTNFEKWFNANYRRGYHLDKDLLVQGNRLYSKETCSFIPDFLNTLICERPPDSRGLIMGVTERKKKGTGEYNNLYNVMYSGIYLGRFKCKDLASSRYREFKKLHFECLADKLEMTKEISPLQAEKLRTRKVE